MSSNDWLPLWRWSHPDYSDAEIIPIYASEYIQQALPGINNDFRKMCLFNEELSGHDNFNDVVYFVRNKEKPGIVKIGCARNFMTRISSSPWCSTLDFMRPEAVQVELVFACLKATSRVVESQAHSYFGPHELMESRGKEWFCATSQEVIDFMKQRIPPFGGGVADYRLTRKPCSDLLKTSIDKSSRPGLLSDLGDILRVYKHGNVLTVVSSLWLPVRPLSTVPYYDIPEGVDIEDKIAFAEKIRRLEVSPFDLCIDIEVNCGIPVAIDGGLRIDWWDEWFFEQFGDDEVEYITDYDIIHGYVEYSANLILTEIINVDEAGKIISYDPKFRDA